MYTASYVIASASRGTNFLEQRNLVIQARMLLLWYFSLFVLSKPIAARPSSLVFLRIFPAVYPNSLKRKQGIIKCVYTIDPWQASLPRVENWAAVGTSGQLQAMVGSRLRPGFDPDCGQASTKLWRGFEQASTRLRRGFDEAPTRELTWGRFGAKSVPRYFLEQVSHIWDYFSCIFNVMFNWFWTNFRRNSKRTNNQIAKSLNKQIADN